MRTHNLLYKKKRHVLKILHVRKCVVLVSYASSVPQQSRRHQHLFLLLSSTYPSAPPIRSITDNRLKSKHMGIVVLAQKSTMGAFIFTFDFLKSMSSCSCSAELRCSQRWGGEGHRELRIASPPLAHSSSSSHSRTSSSFLFVEEKFFSHSSCKQD